NGCRSPGRVDQDGRHPVAESGGDVDGEQDGEPLNGRQRQGEATREGDRHRCGDARERSHEHAEQQAQTEVEEDHRVCEFEEALDYRVHSGTFRMTAKIVYSTATVATGNTTRALKPRAPNSAGSAMSRTVET